MVGKLMTNNNFQNSRQFKGRSLLACPSDYTVIDIETTDFNFFYGDIIEVGAIKVRNNSVVDQYSELIKIPYSIPPHISLITGITNEMLINARIADDVLADFTDFIADDILIAHNANFDVNFLYDLIDSLNMKPLSNDFVDTLRLSRKIHKEFDDHKLDTLCQFYKIDRKEHRSLSDCILTHEVYKHFFDYLKDYPDTLKRVYKQSKSIDLTKIEAINSVFDESNYFYNKSICFTGKMDYLTKKEAAQLTINLGAIPQNNLSSSSNILVLGNLKYQQEVYGDKSSKHKKAEKMISEGFDIEILTELDFLELIKQYNASFE